MELEFRGMLPRVRDLIAEAKGRNEMTFEKYMEAAAQREAPNFMAGVKKRNLFMLIHVGLKRRSPRGVGG